LHQFNADCILARVAGNVSISPAFAVDLIKHYFCIVYGLSDYHGVVKDRRKLVHAVTNFSDYFYECSIPRYNGNKQDFQKNSSKNITEYILHNTNYYLCGGG
jgi:hypothetical protein